MQYQRLKLFITGLLLLNVCNGHWDGAYMRNDDDGFSKKLDWMSRLRDDILLSEIAFPGTQSSASYDKKDSYESLTIVTDGASLGSLIGQEIANAILTDGTTTQALDFREQLEYGIRVFDIRVWNFKDKLELVHGAKPLGRTFDMFLQTVEWFLAKNPSEVVIIILTEQKGPDQNALSSRDRLKSYLDNSKISGKNLFLTTNNTEDTLKEARGKYVIVSKSPAFNEFGLKYYDRNRFDIMDDCYLSTNWDLYWDKWKPIERQLEKSRNGNFNKFYVNYLNGYGGSFPYFVVSGHSSSYTSAPRLSTGLTTPGWRSSYPDFPRVSCFIGICTIAFEGTNILTRDKLDHYNRNIYTQNRPVGIIMTDFPGESLINSIIKNNQLLLK